MLENQFLKLIQSLEVRRTDKAVRHILSFASDFDLKITGRFITGISGLKKSESAGGFVATIAVILIAFGLLSLLAVFALNANTYFDMAYKREGRIQAKFNSMACLDEMSLKLAADFFLRGAFEVAEFNCTAEVVNDWIGNVQVTVTSSDGGIQSVAKRTFKLSGLNMVVVSESLP